MAETPAARRQGNAVMGRTHWDDNAPEPCNWDDPVTHVSLFDVLEYCKNDTIAGTRRYRLPTEAKHTQYRLITGSNLADGLVVDPLYFGVDI